jgi:hypothetical protein
MIQNSSLEFGNFHRIFARFAYATEQGPGGNNRLWGILRIAVECHDMRHLVGMILANCPPVRSASSS